MAVVSSKNTIGHSPESSGQQLEVPLKAPGGALAYRNVIISQWDARDIAIYCALSPLW